MSSFSFNPDESLDAYFLETDTSQLKPVDKLPELSGLEVPLEIFTPNRKSYRLKRNLAEGVPDVLLVGVSSL
jgi:hypothetical protein